MTEWHRSYREVKTGQEIDGDEIGIFLDWSKDTPERPRYARMFGWTGFISNSTQIITDLKPEIVTYLDSELVPIGAPLTQEEIDAQNPRKPV